MIDTDKYEGHTEGPWEQYSAGYHAVVLPLDDYELGQEFRLGKLADAQLIADAPDLLAEVKRLKTRLFHAEKYLCGIEWECYKDAIRFTLKEEITERMRSSD